MENPLYHAGPEDLARTDIAYVCSVCRRAIHENPETDDFVTVSRDEWERMKRRVEDLESGIDEFMQKLQWLIDDSEGVAGLHKNGEFADWKSLLSGGQFEEWLGAPMIKLDALLKTAPST